MACFAVEARQWPTAVDAALECAARRPSDAAAILAKATKGLTADGSSITRAAEVMRLLWQQHRYATVTKVPLELTE